MSDDEDPFAVVAPSEKKMSTYLKKSKEPSSRKCIETSSHGTNSTRSTATSTLPSDDLNFFASTSSRTLEKSSKHKSSSSKSNSNTNAFHNSSSSGGSANFDFGDGLEFGQAFGDTVAFADDGFGMVDQGFDTTHRKAQSSRNFKSAAEPFLPYPAAPKSMRNLSTTKSSFDAFGSDDPFKGMDDDGFGSFGNDYHDDDDGFMFHDDVFGKDAFALSASAEEDGGFRQEALKSGDGHEAVRKSGSRDNIKRVGSRENMRSAGSRENVGRVARSRSGERPKRSNSDKGRGGGGIPRRTNSNHEHDVGSLDDGTSPRVGPRKGPSSARKLDSEGTGLNDSSSSHNKRREQSPRRRDDHSPVRRTRGGLRANRRSNMDHSEHTQNSEARSQDSDDGQPPPRPTSSRRASVSCAYSDGSLEPATVTRVPPVRNKSLTGPAHRPGAARRQRRASTTHTSTSDLSFIHDIPSKDGAENEKDDGWNNERSRNQEKIMDMTRGGKLLSKSEHSGNNASLDHIGKQLNMMLPTDQSFLSSSDRGPSRGRLRRGGKKEKEKVEEEYTEPKDRNDRTKGSLLDRVVLAGGDSSSSSLNEIPSTSSRGKSQSSGLSYSDRIMLAQP